MNEEISAKKQKKSDPVLWLLLIGALLLIFGGAGIFFYPTIANYMAERNQISVIQNYVETAEKIDERDLSAEWEKARAYNASLSGKPVLDPFSGDSESAMHDSYIQVLNLNSDGAMGFIHIPKIKVTLPIYHGTGEEEALQRGSGHIEQTYLPIGGEGTHCVLTGHRGLPNAEMFTRLDELVEGDIFVLNVLNEHLAYEVDKITVVLPQEIDSMKTEPGMDLVTLVTCTPYAVNTHRLLVRGHRTEYIPEEMPAITGENNIRVVFHGMDNSNMRYLGMALGAVLFLLILLILFAGRKPKKRKKRKKRSGGSHAR